MGRSDYITADGMAQLQRELDALWSRERPRVTREVATAAAHGDRSENAEYIYGKKRLREIDRRVRTLRKRIDDLTVVEVGARTVDRVLFGAWVTLEDEDAEARVYRVVGPDEFDPAKGWLSMDSPMGRAVLGRALDEEFELERPKGRAAFRIIAIADVEPPEGPA